MCNSIFYFERLLLYDVENEMFDISGLFIFCVFYLLFGSYFCMDFVSY